MRRLIPSLCLVMAVIGLSKNVQGQAQGFVQVPGPIGGLEFDQSENLYVQWDATLNYAITLFNTAGDDLATVPVGGLTIDSFDGKMARIPGTDDVLFLSRSGIIFRFGPDLQPQPFINLLGLYNQPATAYEINRAAPAPFVTGNPNWGDIAIHQPDPDSLLIYLSATTGASGAFPFITRIALRFSTNEINTIIVAWSQGSNAGGFNQARGLAVNPQGIVLTTLPFGARTPIGSPIGILDSPVAFTVAFPEIATAETVPRFVFRDADGQPEVLGSVGMGTDLAGNFYIASGVVGTPICGTPGSSSGLIFLGADLSVPAQPCTPLPSILDRSTDVTVGPRTFVPHLSVSNTVVRLPRRVSLATAFSIDRRMLAVQGAGVSAHLEDLGGEVIDVHLTE